MKSYTDIEQSKELAEILPIESADMHYVRKTHDFRGNPVDGKWSCPEYGNPNNKHANYIVQNFESYEKIPCWSLAALFDILPDDTNIIKDKSDTENEKYMCTVGVKGDIIPTFGKNPVDAAFEMVIWLKENGEL